MLDPTLYRLACRDCAWVREGEWVAVWGAWREHEGLVGHEPRGITIKDGGES